MNTLEYVHAGPFGEDVFERPPRHLLMDEIYLRPKFGVTHMPACSCSYCGRHYPEFKSSCEQGCGAPIKLPKPPPPRKYRYEACY